MNINRLSIFPMHATQKNTTRDAPQFNEKSRVTGRYLRYPDKTGRRMAEGGLRLQGLFKCSLPNMPLVTIITVCLNSSRTLEQCIQSVLNQTHANIEYIIIDGCSLDGTIELIRQFKDAVDYYVSEPDSGLYHAMNKGLELAGGDYILILNSDDWLVPDCIENLLLAKGYSGTDFVSGLAQYVDQDGNPVQIMRSMPFDAGVRLRMPLRHGTMLLSAQIYNDVGPYDTTYGIIADFHLTIKLFDKGFTHYEIPRPLMFFRNTGVSSSSDHKERLSLERQILLKRIFPFLKGNELKCFGKPAELRPDILKMLAKKYRDETKFIQTLKYYIEDRSANSYIIPWKEYKIDWDKIEGRDFHPLVSIILPMFNAEKTLTQCLDSIISQTMQHFELICIDDAGSDRSSKIAAKYAQHDSRIRLFKNAVNLGLGQTRNKGIRLSRGKYIFHVDPDDIIPENALHLLCDAARKFGSDMIKGAYLHEQALHGKKKAVEKIMLNPHQTPIVNVSIQTYSDLLRSTEGHWSYLYKSELARAVPYPVDLKMGQDSIFLVNALCRAKTVTIISDVVYHYRSNTDSAINTFNFRKYQDALEWRRRAWHILKDAELPEIGNRLLQAYWGESFFRNLARDVTPKQLDKFFFIFRKVFSEAGITKLSQKPPGFLAKLFPLILAGKDDAAFGLMREEDLTSMIEKTTSVDMLRASGMLRVATFCSFDHGGAGTGTQRRVEALRHYGVDAYIFSLVVKSNYPYVKRVIPNLPSVDVTDQMNVWRMVRERAILPVKDIPGYCATELFSLTDSVVNFSEMEDLFDAFDILHFHWVVGMFDFERAGNVLAKKPLVWNLADMNAFTGGCHYSEGCEEYQRECQQCRLLGGTTPLAHETWKIKKAAYQELKNLHIICPSQWMAERAAQSSLLGDRPIHCIPNAYPVHRLVMASKTMARLRLGLPVDKKLILFGADSLKNYRKGGELLKAALKRLIDAQPKDAIDLVVFGNDFIDFPLPVHRLGYITDESRLMLAYSAADAFLFPSREDNAPLTVGESLLCGTPVVAFPVGYVPDIVKHGITGYIANYLDTNDFAKGIAWALSANPHLSLKRRMASRISAAVFHDPQQTVERFMGVYRTMLNN